MSKPNDDEVKKVTEKIMTTPKKFYVSHTTIMDYLTCQRYYYFKTIRRLELDVLKLPFIVGRVMHIGIAYILMQKKNAIALTTTHLEDEIQTARKKFPEMTTEQEEKLELLRLTVPGMMKAYSERYAKFIQEAEHLDSEIPFKYDLGNGVVVVGKIDNLLKTKKQKLYLHELKSSTYISVEYVRAIQTDAQTSLYFHVLKDTPQLMKKQGVISGIIYDVQRKPSIKQKKKESKSEFGKRLSEWYEQYDGQQKFHQETIHQPLISKEDLLNTYRRASDEIRKKTKKEEFYQNFQSCVRDWGFCEHYRLCHKGGETKENLVAFKIRERYKAQEPEKKGRK